MVQDNIYWGGKRRLDTSCCLGKAIWQITITESTLFSLDSQSMRGKKRLITMIGGWYYDWSFHWGKSKIKLFSCVFILLFNISKRLKTGLFLFCAIGILIKKCVSKFNNSQRMWRKWKWFCSLICVAHVSPVTCGSFQSQQRWRGSSVSINCDYEVVLFGN